MQHWRKSKLNIFLQYSKGVRYPSDFRIVGYFLQSKLADCLERNERRERKVPKKGILATFNKIEMPSLQEGFDELNFVCIENGEFKISKWIEDEI